MQLELLEQAVHDWGHPGNIGKKESISKIDLSGITLFCIHIIFCNLLRFLKYVTNFSGTVEEQASFRDTGMPVRVGQI